MPEGRADRDRNGQTPHARVACQCRHDAGWPCKRGAHRALAVRFWRSHHAPRSWPFARGGSARVSRPPGRRSSSSSQCGSTAATAPRRGRPQACRPTAVDGAPSALERTAWPPPAAAVRAHLSSIGTRASSSTLHTQACGAGCRSPPRRPSLRGRSTRLYSTIILLECRLC